MRERTAENARGLRPSRALPWGMDSALSTSFVSSRKRAAGGCERVPTLSRSPMGIVVRCFPLLSFLRANAPQGDARGFRPSRALPWGCGSLLSASFVSTRERAAGGCERVSTLSRSPMGVVVRCFPLLSFLRTNAPPGDARGFRPSRALPWGCGSQRFTSSASSRVSPYSSGTRTVSDWGGTVREVDSFSGCAESRFAERKSVWVTASGRVTRISRSAERL